jgi:ABC-type Na+ efflux pump permease subunit
MKIFDIAIKDMIHSTRSKVGLVFMFIIPLLVTGMFYLMFGNIRDQDEFNLARISVVVVNMDINAPKLQTGSRNSPGGIKADTLSELVVDVLRSEDLEDLIEVSIAPDAVSAYAAVDNQDAQVAVIIPAGFSKQFADPYGQSVIEFYQDPTLTIGPGVVKSILNQFMDGLAGIKIAVDIAMDELETGDYNLIGQVIQEYLDSSTMQSDDLSATLLDERTPNKTQDSDNFMVRTLGPIMAGMMIFFTFYAGTASAESILREEEERTLPRLFTTPTPQATILGGKFLAVFLTVLVQIVVLLIISHLIFGIYWGEIIPLLMIVISVVISSSSLGIFINSMLKDRKQGGVVFGGVLTVTGMIGMIGIFAMNAPGSSNMINTVSLLVPQGWAVRGLFQAMNSQPYIDIFLTCLVMLAWSAVFFVIGVLRFNRRYA